MDDEMSELDHPAAHDSGAAAPPQTDSAALGGDAGTAESTDSAGSGGDDSDVAAPSVQSGPKKRRRGSRGGKGRKRPAGSTGGGGAPSDGDVDDDDLDDGDDDAPVADAVGSADGGADGDADATAGVAARPARQPANTRAAKPTVAQELPVEPSDHVEHSDQPELPERSSEGRVQDPAAAERALVPSKPKIGDTRPAPPMPSPAPAAAAGSGGGSGSSRSGNRSKKKSGGNRQSGGGSGGSGGAAKVTPVEMSIEAVDTDFGADDGESKKRRRSGRGGGKKSVGAQAVNSATDADVLERRRGRERKGRPVGRYQMCVQVRDGLTQVAVLEGRSLVEHYVSRPADDVSQIHGNIYLGRVQNVLPGMEAAFVDISTPKNAVLYRGDVQYDSEDIDERAADKLRIEQMLKARQLIVCQITKNPIGAKGARLTQEVSLPGRFVVLIPNSKTYGISKRLPDDERKRLRNILDRVRPAEHGMIVRTAAENATEQELRADVLRLAATWTEIERKAEIARKSNKPQLLYREPELAVRVIREEFNAEYRGVIIDDRRLHDDVKGYIEVMNPELGDRVEHYDQQAEGLSIFEKFHVHEQLHKALDRKVWLPSGGSLIIEHTEALTVIDVNTGKNVGTSNLEQTVFHNNLEAADEIARQLRLRDVGGIIVIDFIDMEIRENRRKVVDAFRQALSRDKTRSQVFDISELGLVEMTRKRIGEGLLTSFAEHCPNCDGRGVVVDLGLLD
jgi:ribonuclease E